MLRTLLGQYKPNQVFAMNAVIAMRLANEENPTDLLYEINEIKIIDIDTISIIIYNIKQTRENFLMLNREGSSVMEFLGLSEKLAPMLTIDDDYLDYMKELKSSLDKFILSRG